jgi:signal peptidase I
MSGNEIIALVVAIICLVSFSIVFTILYGGYSNKNVSEIVSGKRDIDILETSVDEHQKAKDKKRKVFRVIQKVFSITIGSLILAGFAFSLYFRVTDNTMLVNDTGVLVIATGSMSSKNKSNTYLTTNSLNDQFAAGDIIVINRVAETELAKYDVIAYKNEDSGLTIVHRIRDIQIVNGVTYYKMRGDANNVDDDYELTYKDVVGRYDGGIVPYLGSFVLFLQSNIGIITILSLLYCLLMYDHYDRKLEKEAENRKRKLIEAIGFDLDSKDEYKSDFDETIYYKGVKFVFKNGDLLGKTNEKSPIGDEDTIYKVTGKNDDKKEDKVKIG